jgi:hypothetical protein
MLTFINELQKVLETKLGQIDNEEVEILKKAEHSICRISNSLKKLKEYLSINKFPKQ